jgi:hypothetical protein
MLVVFTPRFFNVYNNVITYTITFDFMIMSCAFFTGCYLCDQIMTDKSTVSMGKKENVNWVFVGNSEGKRPFLKTLT